MNAAAGYVYEFRVTGAIGEVTRSALPELTCCRTERSWVLTGTADSPADITRVLNVLERLRLPETDVLVRRVRTTNRDDTSHAPTRGAV